MKIAYVYEHDARDPSVQSTRPFSLLRELRRRFDVREFFPVRSVSKSLFWHKKLWFGLRGQRHHLDREELVLKEYAWRLNKLINLAKVDIIFSPSQIIPTYLNVEAPIFYCTDAPFPALINYYDAFSNLSPTYIQQAIAQERESHRNATRIIYPSSWAVQKAVTLCNASPSKLTEQPFGANLPYQTGWPEVKGWIERRSRDNSVTLLMISADWIRKGGSFALSVKERLVRNGICAKLRVIGPAVLSDSTGVEFLGRINKWTPSGAEQFRNALASADFLLLPSKAEAYGMALWEGAAHGLPMLGRATGGITSIIRDGQNGLLIDDALSAEAVADWITDVKFGNRYLSVSQQAYDDYRSRGNWQVFVDRVFEN